ncbi:ribonuclease P protein component [Entomobacter blattae]|uniref:Ribonuclease P protein component n=1 Tax=Entomobacter blattae TaxID=2762277 RepID=A0A7H1NSM0_9PROT|nr:ribonuclease P protein component [Entomobacter blattae]QNT78780.1 Ribonuclease P protein component [Entomobacter blattae]
MPAEPGIDGAVSGFPEHLKERKDFLKVAAAGKKISRPGLVLQALEKRESSQIRVGFTVTKKIGKAVIRNRVKRRLRAVVRDILAQQAICGGDLVLIGRAATRLRPYNDLRHDFLQALKKAGMAQ